MTYSIDTSAIIGAWRRSYPPDVFPALWGKLEGLIEKGQLIATEEVLFELERKDDDVWRWGRAQATMFVEVDEGIQVLVHTILTAHPRLLDTRKSGSGADPFVIALAKARGCTVVTEEKATNNP